jgi:tungstate transport system ATP-binding protein
MEMELFTMEDLEVVLGERKVLDVPSLSLPDKSIIALTGPNGSGKTTLLLVLAALLDPQRGKVTFKDRPLYPAPESVRGELRRRLGIVTQAPYLFRTTVRQNVSYPLARRGVDRQTRRMEADKALDLVGLNGFGERSHTALSGGEAQRVALARALVLEPEVLLLDEPFANVDTVTRSVIERVLTQVNRYANSSVIFTTHDIGQAYRMADVVITLVEGKVHEGSMENLFHGTVRQGGDGPIFDTGQLKIAVPGGREGTVTASVPPESIIVSLKPADSSARNTFPGRITAIQERNGSIDLTVDTGEPMVARITERSYGEMELRLGGEVFLIFKAEAVKLY